MSESVFVNWQTAHEKARVAQAAERALAQAAKAGATSAECGAQTSQGVSMTVRLGKKEVLEFEKNQGLSITVWVGDQKGVASTSDLSPKAVDEAVAAATAIAQYTEGDPMALLPEADLMARDLPDLALDQDLHLSLEAASEWAAQAEQAALDQSGISNSEGASLSLRRSVRALFNSQGQAIAESSGAASGSVVVLAEDAQGMQRDYDWRSGRTLEALGEPTAIGLKAAEKTLARRNPQTLKTGTYPVVIDASLAGSLVGTLSAALSGSAQWRKASWLLDSVGQQILPRGYDLAENPLVAGAMGSSAVDSDGLARRPQSFIVDGVIDHYPVDVYAARRLGLAPTGNGGGTANLRITGGRGTQAELLKAMGTGLWVTEMMGQGANPVTGDYSRGAAGYWVENGVVSHPVDKLTLAAHLKSLWLSLAQVADDYDTRGRLHGASLLFPAVQVGSEVD